MGKNTLCRLDETASRTTVGAGDQSDTSALRGVVKFAPAPPGSCAPGETCLNMDYRLDTTQTLHFDGFLGIFGDTDLTNIKTLGASVPFALPSSGIAFLPAETTQTSGRGKENDDRRAAFGSNATQLVVGFDGGVCTIQGNLLAGVGDPDGDSDEATLDVRAVGVVENTPPVASLGPDRSVECTTPAGADVDLDASASSDLENDIVSFAWFKDARGGDDLGAGPEVTVAQPLGAQTYVLTAVDSYMQADTAEATVTVADTTGPSIECNVPATITPRRTPYVFRASASDVCDDGLAAPTVLDYECFAFNKTGKRVARKCAVAIAGDTFTILDSGGIGDHFRWRVSAGDAEGNGTIATCETEVVRPGPGPV
jgi:hypothetical protein